MAGMIPMAVYGLEVPCGDMPIPAKSDIPSAFRITMAAIDPSAEPEGDDGAVPRATLKLIRRSLDDEDDEDEDDFDPDYMDALLADGEEEDDEDSDDDEDLKGGPSDPAKSKKARKEAALKQILAEEGMDLDEDEKPTVNGVKKSAKALGKMPVSDDSDEEDEDDDEDMDVEEFVLCTLDPSKNWQQPLDITVGEREQVFFMVSGTHSIYLTGNYVEPADLQGPGSGMYDPDSDDEMDYDLEPDSDELDEEDEDDELDDMEDPRITEVDDDDDEDEVPTLIERKADKKGKNKRPAEDDEETADANGIDEMIAKAAQKDKVDGEQKLSKKQLKKQKKNDGSANVTSSDEAKKESDAPSSAKSDKKVSFAKELEQGPTPTKDAKGDKAKASLGVKKVQGVTIDDKKLGTGPAAKNGDRVSMRYIGKLEKDNKVFDSNKKGKPFSFKLGAGEVIKGWEIGIQGLSAGGERRITIPAHLAYGSKSLPGIPPNSTLVFDVKLLEINKK